MTPNKKHSLTSDNYYNKLDNRFIRTGNTDKCNILDREFNDYHGIYGFCLSLTGNLQNYDNLPSLDLLDKHRCTFLNIWIYERLSKEKINLNSTKYALIKSKIINFWDDFKMRKEECSWDFVSYINQTDYDKMKRLYDYALNYKMLEFHIERNKYPCSQEDDDYIKKSIQLYNQAKSECVHDTTSKKYCKAFSDITNIYTKDELSLLECKKTLSSDEAHREIQSMLEKQGQGVEFREVAVDAHGILEQRAHSSDVTLRSSEEISPYPALPSAMATVSPILGILLTFFVLHKFTPLGSWIHSLLLKRKVIESDIDVEKQHELLENIYDPMGDTSLRDKNYVSYYPIENN
ncbi:PIR Superfamily Protein [Plasmodium ovale wallikeri]|uniref:PIR Superfamily Protein n=2 Tax=Plasmodium ovale TaxID=36330 RepID=A0A1A9A6D4_PLAOA|nr:PIR Superfamily Protein [Plasmodium ovale wallikeri]SBT55533.1 PIR Superfamily Protein [Plasmodium ovale wallikeri]SBT74124.1 PIR protein [Plasmodium ovale]